jgi:hypothetical protein
VLTPRRRGNPYAVIKGFVGLATTALVAGALGLAGLGLASGIAQAEPRPFPPYHWCPGDFWNPVWGGNWDNGDCHDAVHRDIDGNDHSRDFAGDRDGYQGGDRGGYHGGDRGGYHGGDRGGLPSGR